MSRTSRKDNEIFECYAEEVLTQAMREGEISPDRLLECVYYSSEADLWSVIRTVARLDSAARLQVMSYARKLAEESQSAH